MTAQPAGDLGALTGHARQIIARYPQPRSALLPLLHLVQSEHGYVSAAGMEFCADLLDLTPAEVKSVATFYSMFKQQPVGEYHVGVCTTTLCGVVGGDQIYTALTEHLGVAEDEPTTDGKVSVAAIQCNAACDHGPVVMVNWEFFDNMTPAKACSMVDDLRAGRPVFPTRGSGPVCTFTESARTLAGLPEGSEHAESAGQPGSNGPALAGLRLAREDGWPGSETGVLTPVLTRFLDEPESWSLETYRRHQGYTALPRALAMAPDDVIGLVEEAGLRGRGGAGFHTGVKWGFIPQGSDQPDKPHYLVVNADEAEPGTCKDIPLLHGNPHELIEGMVIAAYAIRARQAFIYLRGEVVPVLRRLRAAVREAYEAGLLGTNIVGSGFDLDVVVHSGAGAYICGEETALLDSLEGRRGQPRLRPPFPATEGLYGCPTVVNNVETVASVPAIVRGGAEWFRSMGSEASPGFTLFSLSGHVARPGLYEAPLGVTLRELLVAAGGVRDGRRLKFWTPGGSSTPILTEAHLDVPLDYEEVTGAGSMLGTKALQIFDETTCVVRAVLRWAEFYAHESCGKCTPCREGTGWMVQLLDSLERGIAAEADLDKLLDICDNVLGRSFCALGDGATSPITSSIEYFRDEYLAHLPGGCPIDPLAAAVFVTEGDRR